MRKPNDVMHGPGFRLERYGRFIRWDTRRTEEEQKELLGVLAQSHAQLRSEIERQVSDLEKVLAKYDALDMIANFAFVNISYDPETYKEYAHEGWQHYVEYVALLYLKQRYELRVLVPLGKTEIQEVQDIVEGIFHSTILFYGTENADPNRAGPPSRLEELRFRSIGYELCVRNPAYYHHETDLLAGLFGPHCDWMEEYLGFNVDDALRLAQTMADVASERLYERRDISKQAAKELRQAVNSHKKGQPHDSRHPDEVIEQLSKLSGRDLASVTRNLAIAGTFLGLGSAWSVTTQELAERTGIDPRKTQAFLDFFSITFGEVPGDFCEPSPTHALQAKPIIRWNSNYLLPIPNLLIHGMCRALEARIKTDVRYWQRYQRGRGRYLEQQTMQLLSNALGGAEYYLNLNYPKPGAPHGEEAELDGLIMYDNKLFLVECRSTPLSLPARRGSPSVTEDLKQIVVEAHDQALRARDYILKEKPPTFRLSRRQTVTLDLARIRQIFLITVSLDSLSVFTPVLHEIADLGIFDSSELPWAVCLTDLRVISELCEFPSMFVHFLTRRLEINRTRSVHVSDELDWFGHYLAEGLRFGHLLRDGIDQVTLMTYTTLLDDYYLHEMGVRKTPTKKPSQSIPPFMREAIDWLEKNRPHGYSDAACVLLDMVGDDRKRFDKLLRKIRKRARSGSRLSDFTMYFAESKTGLTVEATATLAPKEFVWGLQAYSQLKKYQMRADRWMFLGSHLGYSGLIQAGGMFEFPWERDEELEKQVELLPSAGKSKIDLKE